MRAWLAVALPLVLACQKHDAPRGDATTPATPTTPSTPPATAAPDVPTVDWTDETGPAGPLAVTRKLRTAGEWHFTGTVEGTSGRGDLDMRADVAITLTSTGDGKAHMVTTIKPATGREQIDELRFDEVGASDKDPTGALVAVLWPVPPRALRVGESTPAPLTFPMNVQGRRKSDWTQTITFAGYSRVSGIVCARYTSNATMEMPDDGAGNSGRATCGGQFCLEPTTGMLVASVSEMTTALSVAGTRSTMHLVNRFTRTAPP